MLIETLWLLAALVSLSAFMLAPMFHTNYSWPRVEYIGVSSLHLASESTRIFQKSGLYPGWYRAAGNLYCVDDTGLIPILLNVKTMGPSGEDRGNADFRYNPADPSEVSPGCIHGVRREIAYHHAARHYEDRGEYRDAELMYKDALFANPSYDIAISRELVKSEHKMDTVPALQLAYKTIGVEESVVSLDDPYTATILKDYAGFLRKLNRTPEAEKMENIATKVKAH